jgi:hypothetical protein
MYLNFLTWNSTYINKLAWYFAHCCKDPNFRIYVMHTITIEMFQKHRKIVLLVRHGSTSKIVFMKISKLLQNIIERYCEEQ